MAAPAGFGQGSVLGVLAGIQVPADMAVIMLVLLAFGEQVAVHGQVEEALLGPVGSLGDQPDALFPGVEVPLPGLGEEALALEEGDQVLGVRELGRLQGCAGRSPVNVADPELLLDGFEERDLGERDLDREVRDDLVAEAGRDLLEDDTEGALGFQEAEEPGTGEHTYQMVRLVLKRNCCFKNITVLFILCITEININRTTNLRLAAKAEGHTRSHFEHGS